MAPLAMRPPAPLPRRTRVSAVAQARTQIKQVSVGLKQGSKKRTSTENYYNSLVQAPINYNTKDENMTSAQL